MKRLIPFCLSLLLLASAACLPTPTEEYVVSKADNVLEQKLNATPKPMEDTVEQQANDSTAKAQSVPETTAAPVQTQVFPARWDEDAEQIREYVTLAIHADVEAKADGLYPVYRTRAASFTEAQVIGLAEKLLGKPKERELVNTLTKSEWGEYLKAYLDEVAAWEAWVEAGKPNDGVDRDETGYDPEDVERETTWYMEQIRNAPDKLDRVAVSDYSGYHLGDGVRYTLEDGGVAQISTASFGKEQPYNVLSISKGCKNAPNLYKQSQYEGDRQIKESLTQKAVKAWVQPTLERADAEAIVYREIERLGFSGFSIAYGQPTNLYDSTETSVTRVASGWSFTLRRDYDGYPLVDKFNYESSSLLEFGDSDGFAYNKPVGRESITVFVDETGLWFFGYSNPKEIVGKQGANVELLPLSEIVRIVKNTLNACYPTYRYQGSDQWSSDLEVYRMVLTPYTLRVRDAEDYYEVPCWVVFFDGWHKTTPENREMNRNNPNLSAENLIINAVDGTVVHHKAGY
ncbi:MAG: hypothetical protein IJK88_10055 [Clostridia bacterium]|nr:hypothetical protein [Clostridia bacterium]